MVSSENNENKRRNKRRDERRLLIRNDGGGFDLHLGFVFNERVHLHGTHRNVVVADQLSKRAAHVPQRGEVFTLVSHVPGQPHEMLRAPPGSVEHRDYVGQRLVRLRSEVAALEVPLRVPANLSCYEHLRAARGNAVRVSARFDPTGWEQCFFHDLVSFDASCTWSFASASATGLKRVSAARMSSGISIDAPDSNDVVTST